MARTATRTATRSASAHTGTGTGTARSGPARGVRTAAVAAAVLVAVAGLAACGASAGDDEDPDHRTFALQGRTLTIDSDDSALDIVAADTHRAGEVRVTRWFRGSVVVGGTPEVTWSLRDDRLRLRLKCSGLLTDCAAGHRVEVPRGVAVEVEDGDGSVRARGFRDPLSVRTADGSVHVTDSTGPLDLRTADGSMRAEVSSRTVRAETQDGSVSLALGVVPDLVRGRSADGSVTIAVPRAAYRVTTGAQDGGVDVSVPRDDTSSHVIAARTEDGRITVRTAN
ncbi:DUF4097 family beta strand repeat-containing protein [Streptomyces sp. NPDC085946]|uniref:DUF4097 family beta strand repeat-containing protein n=1 Tax=Streptomyces sp. NPDC085946 TaxID=3365744 RepID=UPI0037D44272